MQMNQANFVKLRSRNYTDTKETFDVKLKESIFGVLYVLLKDEHTPVLLHLILTVVEFMEFMIFPFNNAVKAAWANDSIASVFQKFFSYVNIVHYLTDQNAAVYLTIFYISVVAVTLVIINIGYVSYSFSRKYFTVTWPLYVLRTVAKIFVTVLFMPLLELSLSIFHCHVPSHGSSTTDTTNSTGSNSSNGSTSGNETSGSSSTGGASGIHLRFLSSSSSSSSAASGNVYINSVSPDIKCFQDTHYIHMFVSIIVTIMFILICLIVALTFFENSEIADNHSAKENSRADFAMLVSKVVSTFIFTFFIVSYYQWFLIIINFLLSVFQFTKFYTDKPYYHFNSMVIMIILNGIYMWTNFMLLVSKIFSSYSFTGAIYVWLAGIPILTVAFYYLTDESEEVLSKKINECKKGQEIQKHIRYFLHFSDHRGKEKNVDIILKGYIYNHEENCSDHECPLKHYKRYLDQGHMKDENQSESHEQSNINLHDGGKYSNPRMYLYEFAERVFSTELSKFPNATSLRISYAMFLWERRKDKVKALQEFTNAEKYNPPFDEQFIIYRYRKIINEDQDSKHHDGEEEQALDVVSGIAYESHYKQCVNNIIKASGLYMDFWEHILNTSTPDLVKLNDLGKKINTTNTSIEIHWRSMQAIKPNDPKAVKVYAGYITDVLNNKEKGNEMTAVWRETADKKHNSIGYLNFEIEEYYVSLAKDGHSLVICNAEHENNKFGNIIKVTRGASKLFGYTEKELISGKSLESLFLDCYSNRLNEFIKSSLNNQQSSLAYQKGHLFFIKPKSSKPTPVFVRFVDYKSFYLESGTKAFIAVFSEESNNDFKRFCKTGFFLVDRTLKIRYMTPFCHELIARINRKIPDDYGYFYSIFPEISHKKIFSKFGSKSSRDQIQDSFLNFPNLLKRVSKDYLGDIREDDEENSNVHASFKQVPTDNVQKPKNEKISDVLKDMLLSFEHNVEVEFEMRNEEFETQGELMNVEISIEPLEVLTTDNINEEDDANNGLYVIKTKAQMKKNFIGNQEPPKIGKKNIYPKFNEMYRTLLGTDHKFYEIFKKDKIGLMKYYEITDLDKSDEYYCEFNSDRQSDKNPNEHSFSEELDSSEENENENESDESNKLKGKDKKSDDEDPSDTSEDVDSVPSLNQSKEFISGQILKDKNQYQSLAAEDYRKILDRLKNYGKNILFKIVKPEGLVVPIPNHIPQICEMTRHRQPIFTGDEVVGTSSKKDNYINNAKNSSSTTKSKTPLSLQKLSYSSMIVITIFMGYAIFEYAYNGSQLSGFKNNFELTEFSFNSLQYFQICAMLLRNLIMLNYDGYANYQGMTREEYISFNFGNLIAYQAELNLINQNLTAKSTALLDEHYQMYTEQIVPVLITKENQVMEKEYYTYLHAFETQISFLLYVKPEGIASMLDGNPVIYEYLYNNFNEFMAYAYKSTDLYVKLIEVNTYGCLKSYIIIFIVSFFICIVVILVVYDILSNVEAERTKILGSFYKIPQFYLKGLSDKCREFSQKMQKFSTSEEEIGENDSDFHSINPEELEKSYPNNFSNRISPKQYQQGNKAYLVKIIIITFIFFAYFILSFVSNAIVLSNIQVLNRLYNITSLGYVNYTLVYNIIREKIIDDHLTLFFDSSSSAVDSSLDSLSKLNNNITSINIENREAFDSTLLDVMNELEYSNICSISDIQALVDVCSTKLNNIPQFGLKVLFSEYLSLLQKALEIYHKSIFKSHDEKERLLGEPLFNNLNVINYDFLRNSMNLWRANMFQNINNQLDGEGSVKLFSLTILLVINICGFLFIWLPFLYQLRESISRTRLMLDIIPDEIMEKADTF